MNFTDTFTRKNKIIHPFRIDSLVILVILLIPAFSADQDTRLKILNAGSLEKTEINGEPVQQFIKDVVIQRGTMTLYTDQAIQYPKRNEYHLIGSVKLVDEQDTLLSKMMIFYNDSNSYLRANDDIYFHQDDKIITCDSLLYWTEKDSGVAMGNVRMKTDRETMESPIFNYWKTDGFRGTSFKTQHGTVLHENDRFLSAESIMYDDLTQKMTLKTNCTLSEPGKGLSGDLILVQYADSIIQSVMVEGAATAYQDLSAMLYPEDPILHEFRDNMSSGEMHVVFQNGKMSELQLVDMAITEYNVVRDTLLNGVNTASGDTIIVIFADEQVNRLRVFGGGRGVFVPEGNNTTIDSTITYQAEYMDYHVDEQITFLESNASVDYQGSQLMAGYIKSDWNTDMLIAEMRGEEMPTITSLTSEPMSGEFMEFNLITHHGRVVLGETKFNDGLYYGNEVFRDDPNVFHMQTSAYTTCELDHPHFYLGSRQMKMITGDKVIAKPIILYIYDLPVFAIPLAVFPNKGGKRHSGWIMPSFGHRESAGTYFQGLGYYWAPNDYLDGKVLLNFRDQQGFDVNGVLRYVKRYRFNGKLNTRIYNTVYSNEIADLFTPNVQKEWKVRWDHSQTIDPTQNLIISANYMSNNNINQNQGFDITTRLEQRLISQANYSKRWSSTKNSISVSLSEDYDLMAVEDLPLEKSKSPGEELIERTRVVPAITFNHGQSQIFGNGPKWYNSIYWRMSSNLRAQQNVSLIAETDSTWQDSRKYDVKYTTSHTFTLTSPQKFLGWLTLNPVMNFREDWVYKYREAKVDTAGLFMKENGVVTYDEIRKFKPRHTFNVSVSANTKIYGTFPIRLGRLDALRHVLTPTIGFSWHPDFSKNIFGRDPGYFQRDASGELFDHFNGSTAGNTSRNESKTLSFSLNNEFQYKYLVQENSYSKETFLTWNMSSGYNATADSLKFSPVTSSIRILIPNSLDIDVSMSHNLYKLAPDPINGTLRTIDELASFPRLTSMSMGTSIRLKGKRFGADDFTNANPDTVQTGDLSPEDYLGGINIDRPLPSMSRSELWNVVFGLRYILDRRIEGGLVNTDKSVNVNTQLNLHFTRNWLLQYSNQINLVEKKLVTQSFTFTRPLHCWEFQFQWWPQGGNKGFMLKINVINPDLDDIRLKTQSGKIWRY